MPSSFSSFGEGDAIHASHVAEMHGPIQNVERGLAFYAGLSSGTGSDYAVALDPNPDNPYQGGMIVNFKVHTNNTVGSPNVTLNVNGIGAKPIVKNGGVSLAAGDLKTGQIASVIYDGVAQQFHLLSPGSLAASDLPGGIDASKIGGGGISNTEFGYLDGVTSSLQTQLNSKAPVISIIQLNRSNDYSLSATNSYMSLPWENSEINSGGSSAWQSGVNPDRITLYRAGFWLIGINVTFLKAGTPTLAYCHTRVCKNGSGEFFAESHPRLSTTNDTFHQAYSGVVYSDGDDYASLQVFSDGANHKIKAYSKIWAVFLGGG